MQSWIILPDLHVPFHDKKLWQKVLSFVDYAQPYGVVLLGDFLDLYSLGSYNADSVSLLRDIDLGDEYGAGRDVLLQLELVTKNVTKKVYLYGNHEDRYWRELERGDRGKYGGSLLSPTEALRLRERGYHVEESWKQGVYKIGEHLELIHGHYTPVHAAKKHLDEFQGSVVFGHTHRFQSFVEGKRGSWNIGFLGDPESKGFLYRPRSSRGKWTQGFAWVLIDDEGRHYVNPIQAWAGQFVAADRIW